MGYQTVFLYEIVSEYRYILNVKYRIIQIFIMFDILYTICMIIKKYYNIEILLSNIEIKMFPCCHDFNYFLLACDLLAHLTSF